MFQETKQKIMAAVLATLILGMGGYWAAFAGGKKSSEAVAEGMAIGQKVREVAADTPKGRDRARDNGSDSGERHQPAERPTVEDRNDEPTGRRPTDHGRKPDKKRPPDGC